MEQDNHLYTEYSKHTDKYIDPFTDFGFKKLFGEECNKELLLDFLNELLHKIEENKHNPDKYRYDVMLTDVETNDIFYEKLKYVYLEMPKFKKEADELETRFEKWMYVLKNLDRLDRIPEKLRERIFEKLFSAAEIAKLTKEEYSAYINSLNSYRDFYNTLDYAQAKGVEEGLAKGEAERAQLKTERAQLKAESVKLQQKIAELEKHIRAQAE